VGSIKPEDGETDASDVHPGTPRSLAQHANDKVDHARVIKTTRSLYQLALVTKDPWATMSVQDDFITKSFRKACRIHSTEFVKTLELHKQVCSQKHDTIYNSHCLQIRTSHSRVRNNWIDAAKELIGHFYGLVGVPTKVVEDKVALALDKGNYRAKQFAEVRVTCHCLISNN